jgi:hypothetical protein
MAMCPRHHKRDILAQTSSRRVWRSHNPRLAQRRKPWLLVTLQNVPCLQLGGTDRFVRGWVYGWSARVDCRGGIQ